MEVSGGSHLRMSKEVVWSAVEVLSTVVIR